MSDICKDREALRPKYEQFIQTERGKEWKHFWQSQTGSERSGDFGDYLYDFFQLFAFLIKYSPHYLAGYLFCCKNNKIC